MAQDSSIDSILLADCGTVMTKVVAPSEAVLGDTLEARLVIDGACPLESAQVDAVILLDDSRSMERAHTESPETKYWFADWHDSKFVAAQASALARVAHLVHGDARVAADLRAGDVLDHEAVSIAVYFGLQGKADPIRRYAGGLSSTANSVLRCLNCRQVDGVPIMRIPSCTAS